MKVSATDVGTDHQPALDVDQLRFVQRGRFGPLSVAPGMFAGQLSPSTREVTARLGVF